MIDAEFVQRVLALANDTDALIASIRRSLIIVGAEMAVFGLLTFLNFWMLHKTLRVMRNIVKLVRELVDLVEELSR
jgi:hypothetical protein